MIDAATVDGRRRLVLIRRDNVEHLLMIGGPSDIVVEPNIVRAAGAPREAAPARPPTAHRYAAARGAARRRHDVAAAARAGAVARRSDATAREPVARAPPPREQAAAVSNRR